MALDLAQRAAATEKTFRKYRNRPFDWAAKATCIHLARTQLRHMGHRPKAIPDFRSPVGARRALKETGFDDMAALLDSMLERIPPAMMLVGDLALLAGADGFDSIVICAGDKLLGWHQDAMDGLRPLVADEIKAAWRV